jgi:hypothetical protein
MKGIWNFGNLNIDGKKLLKWISKETVLGVFTEITWLRADPLDLVCTVMKHWFHKIRGIY